MEWKCSLSLLNTKHVQTHWLLGLFSWLISQFLVFPRCSSPTLPQPHTIPAPYFPSSTPSQPHIIPAPHRPSPTLPQSMPHPGVQLSCPRRRAGCELWDGSAQALSAPQEERWQQMKDLLIIRWSAMFESEEPWGCRKMC